MRVLILRGGYPLLDSSKLGVKSLTRILPLEEVHLLVTDADAPQAFLDGFATRGIEVHMADFEA